MRAMRRLLPLLLAGCHVPDDGVLSLAFLLEPPPALETRALPAEADTGLPPLAFAQARGRCDLDVPAGQVRCEVSGLPPSSAARGPLRYQLALIVGYQAVGARFDGRALERDPGGRDPDAPAAPAAEPLPRLVLGPVAPDPLGAATLAAAPAGAALDRVVGGELHLLVDRPAGPARVVVIDGRVGNLVGAGAAASLPPAAPASAGGGHKH